MVSKIEMAKRLVVVGFMVVFVGGCATGGVKGEKSLRKYSKQAAASETRSAQEIVATLEASVMQAYSDELTLYAPKHLAAVEEALEKARAHEGAGKMSKALSEALFAEKLLTTAYETKANVQSVLIKVFEKLERLDSLGAEKFRPEVYALLKEEIVGVVALVEEGKEEAANQKEVGLLAEMVELEVSVVKIIALTQAQEVLAQAEAEDAKALAPKSWQEASAAILGVNLFIEQTPEKDAEARTQGEEAHKLALHALFVSREVKKVQALGRKGLWEDVVLGFEAYLGRLAEVSGAGRVSFMSLDDQTKAIESHVSELSVAAVEPESVEAVSVSEPPAEEIASEEVMDGEISEMPEALEGGLQSESAAAEMAQDVEATAADAADGVLKEESSELGDAVIPKEKGLSDIEIAAETQGE